MATASLRSLPEWAMAAVLGLDDCTTRTDRHLDALLVAFARAHGAVVDEATRAAAKQFCRRRFADTFKELPVPEEVVPGTLRLVSLARDGILSVGDLVATQRLGECEVTRIHTQYAIEVCSTTSGEHYLLSGLDFGPGARVVSTPGSTADLSR